MPGRRSFCNVLRQISKHLAASKRNPLHSADLFDSNAHRDDRAAQGNSIIADKTFLSLC